MQRIRFGVTAAALSHRFAGDRATAGSAAARSQGPRCRARSQQGRQGGGRGGRGGGGGAKARARVGRHAQRAGAARVGQPCARDHRAARLRVGACGTRSSAPTRNIISKTPKKTDGSAASGGPNLNNVDAIFFMGHREVPLDAAQKEELLSFVREGKGFVAAHVALTAFDSWPEFLELLGARFDGHPINGPGTIVNESPDFPATKHFAAVVRVQRRVLSAEGSLARQDRRAAAARSRQRAGESEPAPERRLSAGVGEDVRQGPRVLRIVRALARRPGTSATCSRCTSRRCAGRSGSPTRIRSRIRCLDGSSAHNPVWTPGARPSSTPTKPTSGCADTTSGR